MADITLFDTSSPDDGENWYVEPFTKRQGCQTPGQCDDDCGCDCPYNHMTEVERLPWIEDIARIFPDEWLAFIISPAEDDDYEPLHGKLIAHSPSPDEIHDAVNTVLWNQHVYVFFNGDFAAMQASYGNSWDQEPRIPGLGREETASPAKALAAADVPDDLMALIYSAIDRLYSADNLNEALRRLRLARVKAAVADEALIHVLDRALEQIETPAPDIERIIWHLEEGLADFNST